MMTSGMQVAINACGQAVKTSGRRTSAIKKPAQKTGVKSRTHFTTVVLGEKGSPSEVRLRFPKNELPSVVTVNRGRVFLGTPKGTRFERPTQKIVEYSTVDGVRKFFDQVRSRVSVEEFAPVANTSVADPITEQWFKIELSETSLAKGAWEEYPHGWCVKLVQPQPRPWWYDSPKIIADGFMLRDYRIGELGFSAESIYVQLPFHYQVEYEEEGSHAHLRTSFKTDTAGEKKYRGRSSDDHLSYKAVECGMWIPRQLLKPISVEEAVNIFEEIKSLNSL